MGIGWNSKENSSMKVSEGANRSYRSYRAYNFKWLSSLGLLPVDFDFGEADGASFAEDADAEGFGAAGGVDGEELPELVVAEAGAEGVGGVLLVAGGAGEGLEGFGDFGLFGGAFVGGDECGGDGFFEIDGEAGSPEGVVIGPCGGEVFADAVFEAVEHEVGVGGGGAEGAVAVDGVGVGPPDFASGGGGRGGFD